jgi:hypothetical protein
MRLYHNAIFRPFYPPYTAAPVLLYTIYSAILRPFGVIKIKINIDNFNVTGYDTGKNIAGDILAPESMMEV